MMGRSGRVGWRDGRACQQAEESNGRGEDEAGRGGGAAGGCAGRLAGHAGHNGEDGVYCREGAEIAYIHAEIFYVSMIFPGPALSLVGPSTLFFFALFGGVLITWRDCGT